jgi:glutamate racemase
MQSIIPYQVMQQDNLTVVITDSGVGGVGIAAEVYRALRTQGPYSEARVIYYNALFDADSGYNTLKSMSQKTAIFDTALNGMLRYAPDVILLASNTLSALYPYTAFSKSATVPIIGLIEIGVNHILRRIHKAGNSAVIIFATPLTVQEGIFRTALQQHIADDRIIEIASQRLEYAIGDGDRETILRLIDQHVADALRQIPAHIERIYGSLHCTHFGYYQQEFLQAFQRHSVEAVEVLNPSTEMANVFISENCPVAENPQVSIEFVSKVKFHPDGVASLLPYVKNIAEDVATAFQQYHYNPSLF